MNKLLIIIDMQEGFRSKKSLSIVPNIIKLLKTFSGKKVFSVFVDKKNSQFEKVLGWTLFQNSSNPKIIHELKDYDLQKFQHSGYTVLTEELLKFINENKIDEVSLCGTYTDVCIMKTAMDIFDKNINIKVVENACSSLHGKNNHKTAIDSLKHIIGKENIVRI